MCRNKFDVTDKWNRNQINEEWLNTRVNEKFDEFQKQSSKVTSEYAIRKENQKTIELRKNVVAVNNKGETFKSEELIWDENLKRFYSNKVVDISTTKTSFSGTSFWATEDFSYYEIIQAAGPIKFNEDLSN